MDGAGPGWGRAPAPSAAPLPARLSVRREAAWVAGEGLWGRVQPKSQSHPLISPGWTEAASPGGSQLLLPRHSPHLPPLRSQPAGLTDRLASWQLCAPGCREPRGRGQGASGPASRAGCGADSSAKRPHAGHGAYSLRAAGRAAAAEGMRPGRAGLLPRATAPRRTPSRAHRRTARTPVPRGTRLRSLGAASEVRMPWAPRCW